MSDKNGPIKLPPEIEITDDMPTTSLQGGTQGAGQRFVSPGDRAELKAISEFGAKPYTDDERKELSEIVKAFNDRHGTNFTEGI